MNELFYSEVDSELDYFKRAGCQFAAFTARSPIKQTANEDCAGWIRLARDRWVFMVADGLGGLPAGDAASRLAVATILDQLDTVANGEDARSVILNGIDKANQAILHSGTGGATTLVVVEFDQGVIRPYHIGDAMTLVTGQRGLVKFETVSHSPTGYMEEAGLLNEEDAMRHAERHIVSNVLGSDDMRLEIGPRIALAKFDTAILASDGLRDNLSQEQVVTTIRKGPLEKCLGRLAKNCRAVMAGEDGGAHGHPDDLTMVALRRTR
ncbi:MAG: PP2C family protein-serine/threonine phosphatase [bacterium]